ncbi:hypothetical protein GH714_005267 [Hevea brasiliensis]|uniref:9-cis-epoxycarotenoid dioxygenase n=1 Tax=Hevea brasiliensis TaxID=3981 RepID=A0A6A6LYI1_HEVBR|nr:hypothetical protein GH714_005267 [Hevea brasiliensis]
MAASTTMVSNSGNWATTQFAHPFPSSSLLDLGYVSFAKRKPNSKRTKIHCALHSPSVLHFPEQSYRAPAIPKDDSFLTVKRKTGHLQQPQWNLFQRAAAVALDMVEGALVSHERQQQLPKTADPRVQISGNYAPVPEQPVQQELPVTGTIPECINGVYVRNGANPLFEPLAGHHLFDGDGMVHAVTIDKGNASYACRFTETERLKQERVLGTGVANAGLVYFNDRLLAMSEDDVPYQVRITSSGDLETVRRYNFDGQLEHTMIAHPKIDPVSKELFALSYDVVQKPYLKYFRFFPDATKSPDVDIPLPVPTMMHDFAITENFVVIPDQQVVFKLQEMIRGGSPVIYDKDKKSRFGILAKNASDVRILSGWNRRTLSASIYGMHGRSRNPMKLNLKTGKSTRRPIIEESNQVNLEAGMVNRNRLGRKTQYAYLAIVEPWPKVSGFAKVDLFTGEVKKYIYGDEKYGGEPFFLSRDANSEADDDGYILAFVHDEKNWKSELQIVNAMNLQLEATVKLPSRVPYGFHGTFIDSNDLVNQA